MAEKNGYSRAVLEYRNAVAALPANAEAHYRLGAACFQTGDAHCAYTEAARAVELDPNHGPAKILRAQLLAGSSDLAAVQAAEGMAKSLVAGASDPLAFDTLAMAEIRLGKLDDAEKNLNEALQRFPSHLSLSVKLAAVRMKQKDLAGAEKVLREAVAKDPRSAAAVIALGDLLMIRDDLAGAAEQFRTAYQLDPKDGAPLFALIGIQYRTGQMAEAKETMRLLAEIPGDTYAAVRGIYLFQNGQREKAIQEFQRSYQLHKDDRQALTHLITAYAVLGRFEDAMTLLNKEISKNSSNTEARLLRARIYLQFGDMGNAEADVTPCLSAQLQSAEARYVQSVIWAMRGQSRLRKSELYEVLNLDPRHAKARVQLAQILLAENSRSAATEVLGGTPIEQRQIPAILLQQNWIRVAEGRYDEAENAANLLLSKEHLTEAVLQKSVVAFQKKDFDAAGKFANQVLSSDPSDVRAMEIILKIHVAQKRLSDGVSKLKLAALNAPKSATAQFFLGSVLRSTGDTQGAREAFEAARRADPGFLRAQTELALLDVESNQPDLARRTLAGPAAKKDPTALLMLADLDYRDGNLSNALAGYQKVVEIEPDNVTALNNLAFLLVEHSHNSISALQFAQHAKELAPDDAAVDDTLGWIHYQTGRFAAAADRFQSSVNRQPTARRFYHLAMSNYKLGDLAKGRDAFQKALKLDPSLPEAGLARAVLYR